MLKQLVNGLALLGFLLGISLFLWLPFGLLYLLSDGVAWLLHRVLRYRRKVVIGNLKASFPALDSSAVEKIASDFYRHFSDILLEGIKGMFLSEEQMRQRYKLLNPELLEPYFEQGKSVFLVFPHYNNWEWGVTGIPLQVKHRVVGVYKPLRQRSVGEFVDRRRKRFGLVLRPITETKAAMLEAQEQPSAYLMMSDQNPSSAKRAQWMQFLNQPTACLHGADYWGRRLDVPIVFLAVRRVKRGFYEGTLETLIPSPKDLPEGSVTRAFMQRSEDLIRVEPASWLWSHKRWKRKLKDHPNAQFIDGSAPG